jgi:hypothetical protein
VAACRPGARPSLSLTFDAALVGPDEANAAAIV